MKKIDVDLDDETYEKIEKELVQFSVENFQSGGFFHYAANPSFSV